MKKTKTISIIRPWLGGNNRYSLYITIPSKIVKLMDISKDTMLEVRILEDQTITISKHQNSKKTRPKEPKPAIQNMDISKEDSDDDNSYNPLDDVF